MALEFKVPELGENVEKGDVVRVMVKAGDVVAVDQAIFELETDKATIEVPSTVAGKITNVAIKPGDKVKPGQVVLTVEDATASESGAPEVRSRSTVGVRKPEVQKSAEPPARTPRRPRRRRPPPFKKPVANPSPESRGSGLGRSRGNTLGGQDR